MATRTKEANAEYMREWNRKNYYRAYGYARKRLDRYKEAVFALLGKECIRCKFSDERALQIDHKNGGGRKHLKGIGESRTTLYKDVLANPDKYQILCANCNWIKRFETRQGTGFGSQIKTRTNLDLTRAQEIEEQAQYLN